jgi:uroporphyrinogen-III synthase
MVPRVLITRERAEPLAGLLRESGLTAVHVALVQLVGTDESPPTGRPDAVFISSAGVPRFVPDLARHLGGAPVYAVGEQTAEALRDIGVEVAAAGHRGGVAMLESVDLRPNQRVWYVGAVRPSQDMLQALEALPCPVDHWPVYDNVCPRDAQQQLAAALPVDVVTFSSGSAVRRFVARAEPGAALVAVIGARTAADVAAQGMRVDAMPELPSIPGLAAAVRQLVDAGGSKQDSDA